MHSLNGTPWYVCRGLTIKSRTQALSMVLLSLPPWRALSSLGWFSSWSKAGCQQLLGDASVFTSSEGKRKPSSQAWDLSPFPSCCLARIMGMSVPRAVTFTRESHLLTWANNLIWNGCWGLTTISTANIATSHHCHPSHTFHIPLAFSPFHSVVFITSEEKYHCRKADKNFRVSNV